MIMDNSLFNKIINTVSDCVFCKDKDRRFVGVNQAFLDFYGFDSVDVLLGKTDEDMGWHSDPEPFKQDELRVLAGESTYKVQGKCMVNGEDRDIIATKTPIYKDGEIVGLIGSFLDITDTLRRSRNDSDSQIMYDIEALRSIPYFDSLLDEVGLNNILDPLTGIISRGYILDFAKSLISNKTPFTFAIIDLDNFKYINDTYGHHTGDMVLMEVSKSLAEFLGNDGIIGRFGGDELILINLRYRTYDDNRFFFSRLYDSRKVFRRNIKAGEYNPFITATVGVAVYPDNASDYDTLFNCIDKTLYRGKSKGRNCYVIYEDAKHRNLEIKNLKKRNLYYIVNDIASICDSEAEPDIKLKKLAELMRDDMHISDMYYIDDTRELKSILTGRKLGSVSDIDRLITDSIFSTNDLNSIGSISPATTATLEANMIETMLTVRIPVDKDTDHYLMCAEAGSLRIWQDDEYAIMFTLARMLADSLR